MDLRKPQDSYLFGTAVQLAARICGYAEPDRILAAQVVCDHCQENTLPFSYLGEVIPQGFNQPIGVDEVKWQEGDREPVRQIEALRIEVDEANKERHVAEITETDYFARLEDKVRKLRQK